MVSFGDEAPSRTNHFVFRRISMVPETRNRTQPTPFFPVSQSTSQDSPLAQSPEAILNTWLGKLQFISLPAHPQVRNLLADLSQGMVSVDNEAAAQWVFNLLVQYEEFEVFAEVFEAYNRIQTQKHTDPTSSVSSFVSALTLNMPRQWVPVRTSAEALLATFERIQVDKLRVVAPDALTPVPASMGPCIKALLESGKTTSLVVHGLLRPGFLDAATFAKSALKSIELDGNAPPRILRLAFNELMGSLAKCTTLKHISLRHAEFAQFHTHIGQFESSLQSIILSGKTPDVEGHAVDTDHIGAFVNVIAGIPTLSVLELKAAAVGPDSIFDHVFTSKLKGHPALASLTIADWGRRNTVEDDERTLVESALFKNACPNLKFLEVSADKTIPVAGPVAPEDEQMLPLEDDAPPGFAAALEALRMRNIQAAIPAPQPWEFGAQQDLLELLEAARMSMAVAMPAHAMQHPMPPMVSGAQQGGETAAPSAGMPTNAPAA